MNKNTSLVNSYGRKELPKNGHLQWKSTKSSLYNTKTLEQRCWHHSAHDKEGSGQVNWADSEIFDCFVPGIPCLVSGI